MKRRWLYLSGAAACVALAGFLAYAATPPPITVLVGNELLRVTPILATGQPAGQDAQTTTQAIANLATSSGSGLSGMTPTQLPVAATATTVTSSVPVSAVSGNNTVVKTGAGGKIVSGFMTGVLACADLTNGATGCSTATGTSGATIGLLNANKTDSGTNSFTGANNTFTAMAGVINPLTISTATFTPALASGINQAATLVHASCPCTIANPSDTASHIGQTGVLVVTQSSTGSDTVGTWGSQYVTPGGTSGITLSTAANAVDYLPYYVADATHVVLGTLIKGPTH